MIGTYENNEIRYFTDPTVLDVGTTTDWIHITIEVTNMHPEFTPECVYASAINSTTGVETWSPDGCELYQVRTVEGTVVCRCNHLSRFTAGESLYSTTPTIVTVSDVLTEDLDGKLPIMIIFLGVLLLAVIITAITEKVLE